jgi:aryl-alcohol dehydrogenase-like predicted oxidoreductase
MGTDHLIQGDWVYPGWPEYPDSKAFEIMDYAADLGINFFDTSPIYVGGVEYRLGKWKQFRKQKYPLDNIHILSKGGFPFDLFWFQNLPAGEHSEELKDALSKHQSEKFPAGTYASRLFGPIDLIAQRVTEELGHTLRNLNNDVTIYLMHRDDGDALGFREIKRKKTPVKNIMSALSVPEIKDNIWMMGWSNWKTDRVNESIKVSAKNKRLIRPVINSPYFSLFEMSQRSIHALGVQVTHQEMMNPNFQKGIKIMPYSPLGGFSILDKPAPRWENAKAAAKEKYDQGDAYWRNVYHSIFTKANEERWHRVVQFTHHYNRKNQSSYTVDQMINAYALAHPRTDMLAIGPITKEQLSRTVESLELSKNISLQDLEYLYSGDRVTK